MSSRFIPKLGAIAAALIVLAAPAASFAKSSREAHPSARPKSAVSAKATTGATKTRGVRARKVAFTPRGTTEDLINPDVMPRPQSASALVIDQDTGETLYRKNDSAVVPIASITKLMTGMLISQANLPMDEMITITDADVDTEKNSSSRLRVGTTLTRGELLHLALMSSENRAAHALGRTYPGGLDTFVAQMNSQARQLGMNSTHYVEPTGLSSQNRSSAQDLALIVNAAHADPLLRELSTSPNYEVPVGHRMVEFRTTNNFVKDPNWHIGLQKTGFINEAGRCMVMQMKVSGRKLIMVLLDASSSAGRATDAKRMRKWLEARMGPLADES